MPVRCGPVAGLRVNHFFVGGLSEPDPGIAVGALVPIGNRGQRPLLRKLEPGGPGHSSTWALDFPNVIALLNEKIASTCKRQVGHPDPVHLSGEHNGSIPWP